MQPHMLVPQDYYMYVCMYVPLGLAEQDIMRFNAIALSASLPFMPSLSVFIVLLQDTEYTQCPRKSYCSDFTETPTAHSRCQSQLTSFRSLSLSLSLSRSCSRSLSLSRWLSRM